MIDLGSNLKTIEKSGAWFSYNGERLGQGRENTRVFLKEHPELIAKIREEILSKRGLIKEIKSEES